MGYITEGGGSGGGSDWVDDVVGIVNDETTIIAPPNGVRYIPGSVGSSALTNILHHLTMSAVGYISCLPGDIGLAVTDGASNGVLESYDNVTRVWLVSSMDTWAPGGAVTIGGGVGAGTLVTDVVCGFNLAGDVTADVAINEVLHIRGGTNAGWYTVIEAPAFNTVDTNIVVAQTLPYIAIAGSVAHWNITGSEFALIGVDKIAYWNGANWLTASAPTLGTTALFTSVNQFYVFSGSTWNVWAATIDHSVLLNLGVDSHLQYLLLAGRAAGQTGYGGSVGATALDLYANSVTAGTARLLLSDTAMTIHALAATNVALTVGVGAPITAYTTYSDVLTLHPTTTSTQDLGDATHIWQKAFVEEIGVYDTTGAEAGSITRTLTDFNLTANNTGVGNLNLTGTNVTATLGDLAGVDVFAVYSSAPAIVFQVNSLGILSGLGVVTAFVGAADVGKLVALNAAGQINLGFIATGSIDHNTLSNLAVSDVHTQYVFVTGRAGGQTITGGTIAGNALNLNADGSGTGTINLGDLVNVRTSHKLHFEDALLQEGYSETWQTTIHTPSNAATAINTIAVVDLHTTHVDTIVLGIKEGGTDRCLYHLSAIVYRAGGVATILGVPVSIHSEESDVATDCVIDVNGNNVRVMVTGINVVPYRWTARTTVTDLSGVP